MTHHREIPPKAAGRRMMLVDVDSGSYRELAPSTPELSSGDLSAEKSAQRFGDLPERPVPGPSRLSARAAGPAMPPEPVAQGFDPYLIAHDWPERWRAYLHAHFRNHMVVAQVFAVSEGAARKWWAGIGGCNGDKTAVAMELHPRSAALMLYGIAAE